MAGAPPAEELPPDGRGEEGDALRPFRNWHGFLLAAIVVNAFFVYTLSGTNPDPGVRIWYKALIWFPFNAIATAVYLAILSRLHRLAGSAVVRLFHAVVCVGLIVANWTLMLAL